MLEQLKRIALQSQGLTETAPFGKGEKAVLSAVEHLGYVQIDTLAVVERVHHHTLWARVPDYRIELLEALVKDGNIFEYWFHAASYLPMKDYRYALPQMRQFKRGEARYYNNVDPKILDYVLDRIRAEGPLKARDFKSSPKKGSSWWDWKPTKTALAKLFMQGDLMIRERDGMEKIYDLTERVLPDTINTTEPTSLEFAEYLVDTYLRAYGVTTIKQIMHLKTGKELQKNVEQLLQTKIEEKTIQKVDVGGMPAFFVLTSLLDNTAQKPRSNIRILSPFDNSVIHRERLEHLFNFNFRLECYLPKEKRTFGYFCLPILFEDEFIGRMDCKAHRKDERFEIIHLHIEDRAQDIDLWLEPLVQSIRKFAAFNSSVSIKISRVSPSKLSGKLKAMM